MSRSQMTIDDYRAFHADLLSLVEMGLAYAFPSYEPLDPLFVAAPYATTWQRANAIPLAELREIFAESERAFQAANNQQEEPWLPNKNSSTLSCAR